MLGSLRKPGAGEQPTSLRRLCRGQFGLYLAGNGLSLVGTWMQRIACSWLVWEWTHSAFWLGILSAADLLPVFLIGPFAGVAADRWDRLRQNRLVQSASAVIAALTAALLFFGGLGLAGVVLSVAAQGVLSAAVQPARLAMIQQMVSREDLSTAVALNSVNVNLARLLGPAVAGIMILYGDIAWIFAFNAIVTTLFVWVLARLHIDRSLQAGQTTGVWRELKDGYIFIAHAQALWLILLVMLCGGAVVRAMVELMPAIAAGAFARGASGLALLTSATALGAVTSGLSIRSSHTSGMLLAVLWWWAVGGVAAIVLTQTQNAGVAVLAAIAIGAAVTRGLVVTQTFVQLSTPDALRGRVLSVHGVVARGSPAIGALGIGYLADRVGLALAVELSAGLLILTLILLSPFVRSVSRKLRDLA